MLKAIVLALSAGAAVFHLYAAGVEPFTALIQRPIHLAFMAALGFLGVGIAKRGTAVAGGAEPESRKAAARRRLTLALNVVLIAAAVFSCAYLAFQHEALVRRAGNPTGVDLFAGALLVLVVLELARRATGWALVAVALAAIAYALAGPYLPGVLAHRGYPPGRLIEQLYLSMDGIWGVPLGVSADFVYLFVLFGTLLELAGGGVLLIGLAGRLTGNMRGGPAVTATAASGFMGALSGSAVANVVTTGTLTIPLMKRAGFKSHFAGAVEAAASTGGQIMPPIMGAGAFILATWTNIPYLRVALAALIPALLYYIALVFFIQFRAAKRGLDAASYRADTQPVLPRLHLLLPVVIIVVLLGMGRSPMRAAFWGVVAAAAAILVRGSTRGEARHLVDALVAAAGSTVQVAAACATAGIVVGVASLTGIGLRMSELIITLSFGQLPIALLLTALGSIVLGMGLPTTAAYVVLAALGAPALVELGTSVLAAHLFVFYFGCMSNVTPPVALAGFAAAGIAGSSPMRTSFTAAMLASTGFLVPFMFVYGPPLLMNGSPLEVAVAAVTGTGGVCALAAALVGYGRRPLPWWERVLLAIAAIALIFPGLLTDSLGLAILAFSFLRGTPRVEPVREEAAVEMAGG